MFRLIKWILILALLVVSVGFLHYALPQRDIVRVTGTEILRKDFSGWTRIFYAQADSGDNEQINRDLRLINTVRPNGRVSVYRNEDTGFGWPPYFKLDSQNLQAEALDAVSDKADPQWYILRHYGWRSPFLSIYPNAVSLKPTDNPDKFLIPWFNIAILLLIFAVFWAIFVRVRRFWNRRVDPVFDQVEASVDETRERVGGWFKRG